VFVYLVHFSQPDTFFVGFCFCFFPCAVLLALAIGIIDVIVKNNRSVFQFAWKDVKEISLLFHRTPPYGDVPFL
jgi:hypothetical protein